MCDPSFKNDFNIFFAFYAEAIIKIDKLKAAKKKAMKSTWLTYLIKSV